MTQKTKLEYTRKAGVIFLLGGLSAGLLLGLMLGFLQGVDFSLDFTKAALHIEPGENSVITKGLRWNTTTNIWDNVGMWCKALGSEVHICQEYHDGWIDERCTFKETCN